MKRCLLMVFFVAIANIANAEVKAPKGDVDVKVFANTAIVSIYDFNAKNIVSRQKASAKRFTATGWIAFSKALTNSHLLEMVKKHHYQVSAVAMRPPEITTKGLSDGTYQWMVTMPTMVVFKNPSYQQVQYLDVSLMIQYQKGKLMVNQITSVPGKALACEKTSDNLTVKADDASDSNDEKGDKPSDDAKQSDNNKPNQEAINKKS